MSDKAWKAFERQIAGALGVNRIPVPGREGPDIIADEYYIDAKLRWQVPKGYLALVEHAEALGFKVISGHTKSKVHISIMRFGIFLRLKNRETLPEVHIPTLLANSPAEWLMHMKDSTPEGYYPAVIMKRPRQPFTDAIVVMEEQ